MRNVLFLLLRFRDYLTYKYVECKIYSVIPHWDSPLIAVSKLILSREDVNELIKSEKLQGGEEVNAEDLDLFCSLVCIFFYPSPQDAPVAVSCAESYLSQQNYEHRTKAESYPDEYAKSINKEQVYSFE